MVGRSYMGVTGCCAGVTDEWEVFTLLRTPFYLILPGVLHYTKIVFNGQ